MNGVGNGAVVLAGVCEGVGCRVHNARTGDIFLSKLCGGISFAMQDNNRNDKCGVNKDEMED